METKEINVIEAKTSTVGIVASTSSVESDLSNVLSKLLKVQDKDENPDLDKLEPYIWETGGVKMVYFPYEIRSELNLIEGADGLISNSSVFSDERDARYTPARRKVLQREYSISGSSVYAFAEKIEKHFEFEITSPEDDDDRNFNEMRPKVRAILTELKGYFQEIFTKFREGGADTEITTDELITILNVKGMVLEYKDPLGAKIAFVTKSATLTQSFSGVFVAGSGTVHIYDGNGVVATRYNFKIPAYLGRKTFAELGLSDMTNMKEEQKRLIERGQRYVAYTSNASYVGCKGYLVRRQWYGMQQYNAKGRCMIDLNAMKMMDEDYDKFFGVDRYNDSDKEPILTFTDLVYMTCVPFVYGFSLTVKKWGEFRMEDLYDIEFRDDAFKNLVLPDDTKDMILALVQTQYSGKRDIVDGKGGGVIFLLEGSPGVGKTLTAESVSEVLHRPLHMVSIGELGTDADQLEMRLRKILDIATVWNAVLLIDEADVFMEQRTASDIERNAMVGVFLRLLEYYEGILFLTTNRAKNIDQAFFSRISMALHYDELGPEDRMKIWTNLFRMYSITNLGADEIEYLADYELNGRQIKTIMRNATSLALHDERPVDMEDIEFVISKGQEFTDSVTYDAADEKSDVLVAEGICEATEEIGVIRRILRAVGSFFNTLGS